MASKQLWRWRGITGDGNAQDGMLWAESRALLLMTLQQQMVTPLSLKRIAINSAQWRGDKSAEVIHQLATLLKAGLTLSEGLALLADNLAALLEPALLIITGGIIGTLVVAMYLPIFHLGDAMSGMG